MPEPPPPDHRLTPPRADPCGTGFLAGQKAGWRAVGVFLAVLSVYGGTALLTGNTKSPNVAYFDHLADAFLHGQLYLVDPPGKSDLTFHEGRWYVAFPPLAAILMLPWVAALGVANTNTVAFSIVWGAFNVAVVARILASLRRRGWIELGVGGRCWLLLLFALGCVHWQVATEGSVWFLSQTCTVTFIALAVWAAVATRSPWLTGLALAIALWARPNVILTWPLLLGIAAQKLQEAPAAARRPRGGAGRYDVGRAQLIGWAWRSAVPLAISIAGLAGYNHARFGNPFEFGYSKQKVSAEVRGDLARGQFHPHHIPRNLHTMLMGPPRWYEPESAPHLHLPIPNDRGMSIFLTTPALFYLVHARRRDRLVRSAWVATALLVVPILLYYNTGWRQFGYRFSLDFMIPLMILLGVAAGRRVTWPMRSLILLGVLINAWGVVWWHTSWLD